MIARPSLLMLTAAAAAAGVVANGVSAALPAGQSVDKTRLGVAIGEDLGARDQAVTRRKRALDLREQAARATETRLKADLDARGGAAVAAPGAAPVQAGAKAEPEADQFDDLARIYQAMKPARAAVVIEQLDMDVQMKIAQKMRDRSTATIMGAMTPRGAAALSMALARKHALRGAPAGVPKQ